MKYLIQVYKVVVNLQICQLLILVYHILLQNKVKFMNVKKGEEIHLLLI